MHTDADRQCESRESTQSGTFSFIYSQDTLKRLLRNCNAKIAYFYEKGNPKTLKLIK